MSDSENGRVNYSSFDIQTGNSTNGSSTSSVLGELSIVGAGDERRVQGWIEHEVVEGEEGPGIAAIGTFDVAFCS